MDPLGLLEKWLPVLIMCGALLATVIDPPQPGAPRVYFVLYRLLQWCALNVGRARNSSDPVAQVDVLTEQMGKATIQTPAGTTGTPADREQVIEDIVQGDTTMRDVRVRP